MSSKIAKSTLKKFKNFQTSCQPLENLTMNFLKSNFPISSRLHVKKVVDLSKEVILELISPSNANFLGSRRFLPASAVNGAATAFGLESLLPLNILPSNPIMYCIHPDELQQKRIRLNEEIYSCHDGEVMMNCSDKICNEFIGRDNGIVFIMNGTLYSNSSIFCNDTIDDIIQCFLGQLPSDVIAFIPTMQPKSDTKKSNNGFVRIYNYVLSLVGLSREDEEEANVVQSKWIPQPLDIPPEPPTTPEPHIYLVKSNDNDNNKPLWHFYRSLSNIYLANEKLKLPMSSFERNNVRSFTISEYNRMKANGEVEDF